MSDNPFRHVADNPSEDIKVLQSEGHGEIVDATSEKVTQMILGEDDVWVGRLPQGGGMDPSDWDLLPRNRHYDFPNSSEGAAGDELDLLSGEPDPFEEPAPEQFPVFKSALQRFQAAEAQPRVARIDTDKTYGDFVCERAVKELDRRVHELRSAIEEHESDGHGPHATAMRKWDILGAAETVAKIQAAESTDDAASAMPQVPVNLPAFAEGKVKCWQDGDYVVCSMRFMSANGTPRIATMAAKPRTNPDEVAGCAIRAGMDPVTVLGALPELATVACGNRLVRDVAGVALKAQRRMDVCGMDYDDDFDMAPVMLTNYDEEGNAPLAALMYLNQQAEAGDEQAKSEMDTIYGVAETRAGRKTIKPLLLEAHRRLNKHKQKPKTLWQKFLAWF